MTEHDRRIMAPKAKAVKDRDVLQSFAESHPFCAACGSDRVALHIHHIVGGRGGRSDEDVNLLRLCFRPCHDLADGLSVRGPMEVRDGHLRAPGPVLPKLPLAVQLSLKRRANELTDEGLARLAILHGKNLPEEQPIPELFVTLYRMNRPEGHTDAK